MDYLKLASDAVSSLPVNSMLRGQIELLKQHIETQEGRIKLAEDRATFAEDKATRLERENRELRAEATRLGEQLSAAALTEEYEARGVFAVRKGTDTLLCQTCKVPVSQAGRRYECRKCGWHYEEPPSGGFAVGQMSSSPIPDAILPPDQRMFARRR